MYVREKSTTQKMPPMNRLCLFTLLSHLFERMEKHDPKQFYSNKRVNNRALFRFFVIVRGIYSLHEQFSIANIVSERVS